MAFADNEQVRIRARFFEKENYPKSYIMKITDGEFALGRIIKQTGSRLYLVKLADGK